MMAVYVDEDCSCTPTRRWPYNRHCHMMADSVDELHTTAALIGMKFSWFQPKSSPHYDLTATKRMAAIEQGAIPLTRKEFVKKIICWGGE